MSQSIYHDEIKNAILEQIDENKSLDQSDVKGIIETVKNQYLWNSKIASAELSRVIRHFKSNWQEFKEQTKITRKATDMMNFRRYQV